MSSSSSTRSSSRGSSLGSSATSSASSSVGSSVQGTGPTFTGFPGPPPSGMPGQGQGQNSAPCNSQGCAAPPPATLYLYTFLSTLIILLLVSGGIIARSVVLRRRQQIAIANGTWTGPGARRRENYSNRPVPVMFEAYIAPEGKNEEEERWSVLKPFSASDVAPPMKASLPSPAASPHHVPIRRAARDQMRSIVRLHNPFRSSPTPAPAPPTTEPAPQPSVVPPSSPSSSPSPDKVRVALLVAMPWRRETPTPMSIPEEEEELPYLEFGVLDVDVVDLGKTSDVEGGSGRADSGSKS